MTTLKSYSSDQGGLAHKVRDAVHLLRAANGDIQARVAQMLSDVHRVERLALERFGVEFEGQRMLDVGPGQQLAQLTYFSARNDVVGIDLDVIPRGFDARAYVQVAQTNGGYRLVKTVARKGLLVDMRYRRELARALGRRSLPSPRVLQMDAAQMSFPASTFDVVYAFAVFQHLPDPAAVLDEMARVLRPAGLLYLDFILYTSPAGSHDVRVLGGNREALPPWVHLRPATRGSVRPNAYLNRLRLPEWRRLFDASIPGADVLLDQPDADKLRAEAVASRSSGELNEYSLEELLTTKVSVLWTKPPSSLR